MAAWLLGLRYAAARSAVRAPAAARPPSSAAPMAILRRFLAAASARDVSMADARQLLGMATVESGAAAPLTEASVKAAYRRQAALVHPDKNPNSTDDGSAFKELKKGYELALAAARHHDVISAKDASMASWKGNMRRRKSGRK